MQRKRVLSGACFLALLTSLPCVAEQIDTATFVGLHRGMSESEILLRAGLPDLDTGIGYERRETGIAGSGGLHTHGRSSVAEVRQLHYIPGPGEHDPYLTVITIKAGRVSDIERTKVFTRQKLPPRPASVVAAERLSDDEIKIKRAERTLHAAEQYAATRARLREQSAQGQTEPGVGRPLDEASRVYRARQPDGSVYFGDRPAGEAGW